MRILLATLLVCVSSFGLPTVSQADGIPFELPRRADITRISSAEIVTNRGAIIVQLFTESAPWHVANFKYRADAGLLNNLPLEHFLADYIVQFGPSPSENQQPRYSLPPEFSDHQHIRGTLGMARLPDDVNRERRSDATRFHLLLGDAPHMNGKYTVFGQVVQGWKVLDGLQDGDTVLSVTAYVR